MSRRFAGITEEQWRSFVADVAEVLELREGDRVFEVQCGTGELLRPLYDAGCAVGGIDPDARLIAIARHDMPSGEWSVGEATALDTSTKYEVVVACGTFSESLTLANAADLLDKMVRKAGVTIAILAVPSGLPFDERWFLHTLTEAGAASVRLTDLHPDGATVDQSLFSVIARLQ